MPPRTSNPDELRIRVDEVLYYFWDPIGVANEPFARAEYESYVPKVLQLLIAQDDPSPIAAYLADVIRSSMVLAPDMLCCNETAALLQRHKQAIKEGCT